MECVIKGTISLFIDPGKRKGDFYIESPMTGFVRISKGKNHLAGVGTWPDFKGMLAFIFTDIIGNKINEADYNLVSLSKLIRDYNIEVGAPVKSFNLTPSSHLLGDFTVNKSKPYIDFGIATGYQYTILQINDTEKKYLKSADYYASMRPVAGVYYSRKTSKIASSLSLDLAALYFRDSYYAYSNYIYSSDHYEDDILIDLTGIQIPIGLKLELSKNKIRPFIRAGVLYTFLMNANYTRIEEKNNGTTVYTNIDHRYKVNSDIGIHGSIGLEVPLGTIRKADFELTYQRDTQNLRSSKEIYWAKLYNHNLSFMIRINL